MPAAESLPAELARILGAKNVLTAPEKTRAYTEELRGRHRSECLAVALPANAEEVSAVVSCCARAGAGIVPQGGNTGTMGGAVARRGQVILNLRRMNRVLGVDEANHSMHVQAGCVLADIQEAARARGRLFPLSLGAQGSCQIGGNLATNAGGVNVLHYGNARDLALGLEVVLADGRIWSGLSALRKDNTGYDLKNLFIGSEGTLGVITAAVLKLFPALQSESVALAGLRAPEAALELLGRLRAATADRLVTFELMGGIAVHSVLRHFSGARAPLAAQHEWYALLKAGSAAPGPALRERVEACLARALQDDVLQDAVIAENETQARELLRLREQVVEAQRFEGGSIKHDVSVPVSSVPEFLRRAERAVTDAMPGARPYPYGHMGDGNMHFNISQPPDMETKAFLSQWDAMNRVVHEVAHQLGGSFSAEHGIGISKLGEMRRYKDPVSLALYRQIKRALDPGDLFNPGKLLPAEEGGGGRAANAPPGASATRGAKPASR
ncbi:MAG: FAD-binding oxidoreductase [Gammaproteobacteria bacterium]|nr:FAD-binding oxidoreductase [Gammaproteobacteria bacterium]